MMLLSRFWYVLLSVAVAVCLYVVYLAVGQYNRQNATNLDALVASDLKTVEYTLKIDTRRRIDRLLIGSSDRALGDALGGANGKDKVPPKSRDEAKKALASVMDQIEPEFRPDALFAVDRQGRVVALVGVGFETVVNSEDFELGGYPAVYDALHGFLRDDSWALGGKLYIVGARPVEVNAGEAPVGAIVALKDMNKLYAQAIAKKTNTNVVFYSAGSDAQVKPIAFAAGDKGFDEGQLQKITDDVGKLSAEDGYLKGGGSSLRMLASDLGARYERLNGDAWDQQAGFAVMRNQTTIASPTGFINGADDTDKKNVPFLVIGGLSLGVMLLGMLWTVLEHTMPLRELAKQAEAMKLGTRDGLQVPRFRGAYRLAAQNINSGMERIIEKGGGTPRKAADLESILGPVPAQPAMSAFQFPLQPGDSNPNGGVAQLPTHINVPPALPPSVPGRAPPASAMARPTPAVPMMAGGGTAPNAFAAQKPSGGAVGPGGTAILAQQRTLPLQNLQQMGPPAALHAPPPALPQTPGAPARPNLPPPPPPPQLQNVRTGGDDQDDEDATMVAAIPAEVLAQATGENRKAANTEAAEWLVVYDDFIRTKKQCNEPTDGLTYEKFSHTLKKNRDALMARHGCKRVRFSVYVKEGRASLKATPVKD